MIISLRNKKRERLSSFPSLPDLDSNQDILNQNQLYYPYTIRQSLHSLSEWGAKIGLQANCSKFLTVYQPIKLKSSPKKRQTPNPKPQTFSHSISSFSFNPLIRSSASATTSHIMVINEPGFACL